MCNAIIRRPFFVPLNTHKTILLLPCVFSKSETMKGNRMEKQVEQIRVAFLSALQNFTKADDCMANALRTALAHPDVDTDDLVEWATEAGHDEQYVRSVISRFLVEELGIRRNAKGQGNKPSKEGKALAAYAVAQFGDKAAKHLLAAYRICKAEAKANKAK